jgi:hydrogenase-4 component E
MPPELPDTTAERGHRMSEQLYGQLLDIAAGALLLTAVLILWRRELAAIIDVFALQGFALAVLVGLIAVEEGSAELGVVAVGVLVLRVGILPWLLRRALAGAGATQRETKPLVNVVSSLLAAATLTLLAYAVSQPLVTLDPSPATHAIPVAMAVVLIGFFVLVTRRLALSQLVGFLLMDNGITAVGFLTTAGVGVVVELGVSLDVLLVVLVLQILKTRIREAFGVTDLDDLRELHD